MTREIATLRRSIAKTKSERPFAIDAFVVLPDHLHCIWTLPPGDRDFSTRWGAIKAQFSRSCRRAGFTPPPPVGRANGGVNPALRRKGEVGLWQPRFWEHHIRNDTDFTNHIRYCWFNPLKHGLVSQPEGWPYSSIHRDIRNGRFIP
ncbi:MAG: transposase [Rhodobacteraceae bacterium]|nr:transposase [Paracoccaceae bacterium]